MVAVETPEGILLELRPAGLVPRFYAFMVDWMIRIAVMWVAIFVTSIMGGIGMALWFILLFALEWLYPIAFELMPVRGHARQTRIRPQGHPRQRPAHHAGGGGHA